VRIVLVGAPGSGKGTQSVMLAKQLGLPAVSSGEVMRDLAAADSQLGREVASYMNRGDLVPDDLVVSIMRDALGDAPRSGSYILEGFPRTVAQARRAESSLAPDAVIDLVVPDDVARARLARRAGAGRADDASQAVIEQRMRGFHAEIDPILQHYRDRGVLISVDANRPPEVVNESIRRAVARKKRGNGTGGDDRSTGVELKSLDPDASEFDPGPAAFP
jgi:adenylate kinase